MAQHWVPKHILLGFADSDGFVWAYDKAGHERPKRIHVKVAATGGGGRRRQNTDSVERLMASIEGAALPVVKALRTARTDIVIERDPKLIMAFYLEMLFSKRSPSLMDAQKEDAAQYTSRSPKLIIGPWLSDSWWPSTLRRLLFQWMTWTVLECGTDLVAVSDRGLSWPRDVQGTYDDPLWREIAGATMLAPSSRFYLPLNKNRVLLACWNGRPSNIIRVVKVSPAQIRTINSYSIDLSGRFVFSVERSSRFAKFVQNPKSTNRLDLKLGKPNARVRHLDSIRDELMRVGLSGFDLERCLAPRSPNMKHSWQEVGTMPSVGGRDLELPTEICEWCKGWKQKEDDQWAFSHYEAERQRDSDKARRTKNWWDHVVIRDSGGRLTTAGRGGDREPTETA